MSNVVKFYNHLLLKKKFFIVKFSNRIKLYFEKIVIVKDLFLIFIIIKKSFKILPSSIKGQYNILTRNNYYKIAIKNTKFFLNEKNNIHSFVKKYQDILKFLPNYEYYNYKEIHLAKGGILLPLNVNEHINAASYILKVFNKYSIKKKCVVTDFYYLNRGLRIIERYNFSNYNSIKVKLQKFLKNEKFSIGPCHGDFHSKNLLKDKENNYYIIDLDCYRDKSLQELDPIYYIIQVIVDANLITWYEAVRIFTIEIEKNLTYHNFINRFLEIKKINLYLLIYFLDRIAQDENYFVVNDKLLLAEIKKTFDYFTSIL